jgi:acetyl-CoA acetyltransferase
VESHDCFTSAELIEYEAMGLANPGEGERAIHEGWVERDGKLPVNVSGGLKAKGHPVGATGVSMHVMTAMQLSGTAPGRAAASQGQDRRRVQHGRRGRRQLRQHPRAAALGITTSISPTIRRLRSFTRSPESV